MKTWTVDDVMTRKVVSVKTADSYRDVVDLLIANRLSAVPVVDDALQVAGVVSEADLLRKVEFAGEEPRMFEGRRRRDERRKAEASTVADLMSAPAVVTVSGTSIASAARLMDREKVKRLPVVDDEGRLVGIVSRSDLLKAHLRPDDEILADVESGVLLPYVDDEGTTVTAAVVDGVVTLSGRVQRYTSAEIAERLTRQVAGVVEVRSELGHDYDDRQFLDVRKGTVAG
ncbi:CBS domain-containing protein [Actinoplanes sp. NPDC048796]|uniref:CBS domain-containing protein n=1 Tax=unclassified Actinoplanes TaxID=2626549 RepID=UPI0033D14186